MTVHSLQELNAVLNTKGTETIPKGKKGERVSDSAKLALLPPNYCVVCSTRIEFHYPYGRWLDPHEPKNAQSGTCSAKCEEVKDPESAAFRRLRMAGYVA